MEIKRVLAEKKQELRELDFYLRFTAEDKYLDQMLTEKAELEMFIAAIESELLLQETLELAKKQATLLQDMIDKLENMTGL